LGEWWIDEPRLLGSSNPDDERLHCLHQRGFSVLVSLLVESEQKPNYSEQTLAELGFVKYRIPIGDYAVPTLDQILAFVRLISDPIEPGHILVHCQGGNGRTGTMAAAYWVSKGCSPVEAIARVRLANPLAVETVEQEEVLDAYSAALRR